MRWVVTLTAVAALSAGLVAWLTDGTSATERAGRAALAKPVDPGRRIEVSLILRMPGQAGINRLMRQSGAGVRVPLKPAQFGSMFGLSTQRMDALRRQLLGHGLRIEREYPQRTAIRVSAPAATLESIFSTTLTARRDSSSHSYLATSSRPRVPAWLARDVVGVTGLSTRPVLRPAEEPVQGLTGDSLAKAYDFASLRAQGIDGSGQTIAVVSFSGYASSDLDSYDSEFSISGPPVQRVPVNGGTNVGAGQDEVNLDLDTIRAVAPGAQILDYEAPLAGSTTGDVINQIVADRRARVVTDSWGECDLLVSPAERTADENALAAARASGITVFSSSGDNGAYECQSADLSDHRLSVNWPAASDNVVAVGGTLLSVRSDGSYMAEYGWEDVLGGAGSGGGLASSEPLPAWQVGPGVHNAYSNGRRQVPDVAGPADPASGMLVLFGGRRHMVGGTSAAAPFWAASMLLVSQYAQRHGVSDLGFLAPLLYRLAADPRTAAAFHEPLRGGNRNYSVTAGWNYVTGLGSPDVGVLARDVVLLITGK